MGDSYVVGEDIRLKEMEEKLYEHCETADSNTYFSQSDLAKFNVAKDVQELMEICQALVNAQLFNMMMWDNAPCWKVRQRETAAKLRAMGGVERNIYQQIESTGTEGMWTRAIRTRTQCPPAQMNKHLKSLEAKRLIKSVSSVKNPGRKIYMLYELEPSEEISGGSWHSNGELDMDLIEVIGGLIVDFVRKNSWATQRVQIGPDKKSGAREEQIPYHAGYLSYPTAKDIFTYITELGVIQGIVLRHSDLQSLLDMLVWDGRLERMAAGGYRSIRLVLGEDEHGPGNGLTMTPCGRCPVFDLCGPEGPVSADNCIYFDDWLRT